MILWIASYPRSGNRFTREVLQHCFGLESCSIYYEFAADFKAVDRFRDCSELKVIKTHEKTWDPSPAIYVYRDGRDSLVSYAHFLKTWEPTVFDGPWEELLESLILGRVGFGDWSEHIGAWQVHSLTTPVAWISYEELLKDSVSAVQNALTSLSIPVPRIHEIPPAFPELKAKDPGLFRKGKAGSWREEMPTRLVELFEERHALTMRGLGYSLESDASRSLIAKHASGHAA